MSGKKDIVKEYTNGEVTVVWKPGICIHSEKCFHGLPEVFNPKSRPWIKAESAATEAIVEQIKKCPSGALSYFMNGESEKQEAEQESGQLVELMKNGPLMVYGHVRVKAPDGSETRRESRATAFCRCGASGNKPYCDGSHKKIGFEG